MSLEHQETVLDIAAEFRQMNDASVGGIIAVNANVIADRLESAAKRDAEVIADLRNRVRIWTEIAADELRLKCDELYANVKRLSGEDGANG